MREQSDEQATVDDNLIPGIPDTLENVVRALVKAPPKKRHEWEFIEQHEEAKNGSSRPTA